ncbi:MAG: hypothetical protein V7609_2316 [Verrucomicrobiota bacterium]
MKRHFSDGGSIAIMAAGFVSLFLFTLVLSAVPQLHERIHPSSGATNHECAVTLLTSGNYQHTVSDTIALAPPTPPKAFVHISARLQLVSARLEFSLLEHAPPALS